MGRTGAFLSIHAQLEKIKTEALVDLFQFVKSARIHRAGLIAELVRLDHLCMHVIQQLFGKGWLELAMQLVKGG